MRIKIIDKEKCTNCTRRTCSMTDTVSKSDFYNLKTEQHTCPVKMFAYGVTDEQLELGYIDFNLEKNDCLYCCLCAFQCSQNNLLIEDYQYDAKSDLKKLTESGELQSQGPSNIIALSYLNHLFDFAANTNLVRTLSFDGVVFTNKGELCLVEVDINNDSLECCRRLLADIVLHNHKNELKIKNGLMVLNDFPKEGSRDVVPLIQKIREFESTSGINFYITTFSLLRYFVLHLEKKQYEFEDLLFNTSSSSKEEYLKKIYDENIVDDETKNKIFE